MLAAPRPRAARELPACDGLTVAQAELAVRDHRLTAAADPRRRRSSRLRRPSSPGSIVTTPSTIVCTVDCESSTNAVRGTRKPRRRRPRHEPRDDHARVEEPAGIRQHGLDDEVRRTRRDLIEHRADARRCLAAGALSVDATFTRSPRRTPTISAPEPLSMAKTLSVSCSVKIWREPGYSPGLRLRFTTTPSIGETMRAFAIWTRI